MRSKRSYYLLAVFIFPALLFLQNPAIKEPLRGFSMEIFKPVMNFSTGLGHFFGNTFQQFQYFCRTFQNQAVYEKRMAELESEINGLRETAKENERLRKLLEFRDVLAGPKIAARVIGWDPSPWRKTMILDKGLQQGIGKDMTVVVPDGLVGRVIEAGPSTSRVIMIVDADSRVSAIAEESRAQGVLAGQGHGELTLEYMELENNVAVGETVSTSGLNGLFPKGIRIGKITSLGKDATGLHLQAKINSFVRFSKLEEVLCLGASRGK